MILSARSSVLRSHFSESRDLVASRVAARTLLSRIDAAVQALRNEIAHRVVQQIGRGSEEIPEDVKDLHAEAAGLESLRQSAAAHLDAIERFSKMLSGEVDGQSLSLTLVHEHSRMVMELRPQLFVIESAGLFAFGCHTHLGFKVGRGSLYRKSATPSLFRVYKEERAEIERLGVVAKAADGQWVFQKDHIFRSPGVAAMVTFGVAKSGNAWVPAPVQRIMALMERHGIEPDLEAIEGLSAENRVSMPAADEGVTFPEEFGLRSRKLRDHALQSFSPDGCSVGENRWAGHASRVLHLTRAGESPWKFQIRRDDLEWVLQDPDSVMTRSILLICGERGFVPVRAHDIDELIAGHWAKGTTEKAYAVIGVKHRRGDQMEVNLCGTGRSLRHPVTLRE